MASNIATSAVLVPASEILYETIQALIQTVNAAKSVLIQKENFNKFSTYLERITLVLRELSKLDIQSSDSLKHAIEILNGEIKVAKQLALFCINRNKVYLFLNCRRIIKQLEGTTIEISRALGLLSSASLDGSSVLNDEITNLCKSMADTKYQITTADQGILEKIESGIEERNVDRSYVNNLITLIAEVVGISSEQSEVKREFEALKSEIDTDQLREDRAEVFQMEQIVALLCKADMITTPEEKEVRYLSKRNSLGRQALEPLQSFYCPITKDIMVDPVETSHGQTFERSAIEKWLEEGNEQCPLTMRPLNKSLLRSNRTLRESIEEWKDRNTMIAIASLKPKVLSNEEQEVLHSLGKLQGLCIERELHKEWIIMEDYVPILIGLLGAKVSEIRKTALAILFCLAKDNDNNKERIGKVDGAIELIVHSLARKVNEIKAALKLLLELSRNDVVRNLIGSVQGCILLLATMSSSDDPQAAKDAHEILGNLSFLDENVVQMANANYFGPLLSLLSSGTENVKLMIAKTLSEVELTDHSKLSLFKDGAKGPLLQLLSHDDIEMKKASVRALRNLSTIPQNGLQMIKDGALGKLFGLLYCHRSSSRSLREQVAATIMNLAISTTAPEADQMKASIVDSEEEIFKLFSLISLTGPQVQQCILQTFIAMCQSSSGLMIRTTLKQISAAQVLVQLCEVDNDTLRASAVKLFHFLTQDCDNNSFLEHVNQRCIDTLLKIAKSSNDIEEIASAIGVISNLPRDSQMTEWLLNSDVLQVIFTILATGITDCSYKREVVENSAKALCRFTVPTNHEWQKKVAEARFIPLLVDLLLSGTSKTKESVAISLKQLSESSSALSTPSKKKKVVLFGLCLGSPLPDCCPIHSGICTPESTFCLLECDAIRPLVGVLEERDAGASEASLDALLTLIEGEQLQKGTKVLDEANAIGSIVKLLSSDSPRLQEKALKALERVFRLLDFKQKYGTSAQLPLVDITQRGTSNMKSTAAKTLAHLNVIHDQSSFF